MSALNKSSWILVVLFFASSHGQDSETSATSDPQPIIYFNFGTTFTLPADVVAQSNITQETTRQIDPNEALNSLCRTDERRQRIKEMLRQIRTQIDELAKKNNASKEELRRFVFQIDELRSENDDLRSRLLERLAANNSTRQALLSGFVELDDGWAAPLNGYQYKVVDSFAIQSWNESRAICQSWGADMIVHGFQDHTARLAISRALDLFNFYWLGLNDLEVEGEWLWVNGFRARTHDPSMWWHGVPLPDFFRNAPWFGPTEDIDCARSRMTDAGVGAYYVFLARAHGCFGNFETICEKLI